MTIVQTTAGRESSQSSPDQVLLESVFSRFELPPHATCSAGVFRREIMSSRRASRVSQGVTNSATASQSQRPGTASAQLTARLSGRWVVVAQQIKVFDRGSILSLSRCSNYSRTTARVWYLWQCRACISHRDGNDVGTRV